MTAVQFISAITVLQFLKIPHKFQGALRKHPGDTGTHASKGIIRRLGSKKCRINEAAALKNRFLLQLCLRQEPFLCLSGFFSFFLMIKRNMPLALPLHCSKIIFSAWCLTFLLRLSCFLLQISICPHRYCGSIRTSQGCSRRSEIRSLPGKWAFRIRNRKRSAYCRSPGKPGGGSGSLPQLL